MSFPKLRYIWRGRKTWGGFSFRYWCNRAGRADVRTTRQSPTFTSLYVPPDLSFRRIPDGTSICDWKNRILLIGYQFLLLHYASGTRDSKVGSKERHL